MKLSPHVTATERIHCANQRVARTAASKRGASIVLILAILLLASAAAAQTLTGTVTNGTTGKPAAGDEVILLKLGQGMEEGGRTRTDLKGNFSFKLDDAQSMHLVRVIHQEVTYHHPAPPGSTTAEVQVYDVGKKIEGVSVSADIMRLQAESGQLEVIRMFAVDNASKPPRTQMSEHNFEFYVPEGAKILQGTAMTADGRPVNSAPVPENEKKDRYSFIFPLRPGITQFQVAYELPYTGEANIDPKALYDMQHFVAILPKTMQFSAAPNTPFEEMKYPNEPDAVMHVASNTKAGQPLSFRISGLGALPEQGEGGGAPGGQESPPAANNGNRPGGGLGPPIDAPDPLQKYRWQILGGIAAALAIGAVYVASRQQAAARAKASGSRAGDRFPGAVDLSDLGAGIRETSAGQAIPEASQASAAAQPRPNLLLEALKEELFQLEIDRRQGRVSAEEYDSAKAALDQTLDRALRREAQKT